MTDKVRCVTEEGCAWRGARSDLGASGRCPACGGQVEPDGWGPADGAPDVHGVTEALGPMDLLSRLAREEQAYIAGALIKHKPDEPGPTPQDVAFLLWRAHRLGLDAFSGQLVGILYKGKLSIQVTHDGYLAIAERSGRLLGVETKYDRDPDDKPPMWAQTTVSFIDGRQRERSVVFRCLFREFTRGTDPWRAMPWHMIGLRTECHALKRAFPELTAGLVTAHDPTEVRQLSVRDSTADDPEPGPVEVEDADEPWGGSVFGDAL